MYVPLPGDGTKTIINKLIGAIGTVAAIGGNMLWSQWANSHGLPEALPPGFYLQIVFVISLVLVIHESGHAIAALVLRMKVTSITIGPFLWWTTYGKWRFQFRPAGLKSFLGYISVAPAEIEGFRLRKILQVAAGPFASIVTGLIASAAVITAPASRWQDDWLVFSTFATISLLTGILNLVPFQIGSGYSDGAKLFQLVRGGLWSDYHLLLAMIYATTVTPIRAREFDIATILRAAGTIARGQDQLLMHLCAYSYFLDIDELSQAADALDRAEAFCEGSSVDIPMEWYSVFVFGLATLRRDATRARAWWDRLEAKKGSKLDGMYWSSLSALLWSEGHLEEARDAWEKGDTWARQLPESGFAEAEKNALNILTRAMNETLSTRPNTVGIAAES